MIDNIFFQISILLGVTAVIAFVVRFLRQPFLIAYIIAGIVAGPLLLNFIDGRQEAYQLFSEFGIVLLLFVVGLSLNFNHMKKIGKVAILIGFAQAVVTVGLSFLCLRFFGVSVFSSLYLSIAVTFSSTIIVSKLLSDKRDTESVYGRYTIGLLVVQDVIAIAILVLMVSRQHVDSSLAESLLLFVGKAGVLVGCVYFLAKFFIPFILHRIAGSAEFLFLFTIAWCFVITSTVHELGLSLEIGAIVAGISLGSSPYQPEIASRIRPLRDFFLILFFIILGSQMNIVSVQGVVLPALALTLFVLLFKPAIVYILFRSAKFTRRNSFLAGSTSGQVSEFGFILLFTGLSLGQVAESELAIFTLVALATIFFSSYVMTYNESIYRLCIPFFSLFGKDRYQQKEEPIPEYDAWVIGHHRIGWKVCEALAEQGISFAVIDFNPEVVQKLKKEKIPVYFGDAADVEFLSQLPLEKAKLLISTIPEVDDQFTLIRHVRSLSKKPFIIANLLHGKYLKEYYAAGADYVMMPHLLGGYRIAEILHGKISRPIFRKLRTDQEKEMALRFTARVGE